MDELAADGKSSESALMAVGFRLCAERFRDGLPMAARPAGRTEFNRTARCLPGCLRRSKRGMQAYLSRKFPEVLGFVNVLMEGAIAAHPTCLPHLADLFFRPTCRIRDVDGHTPRSHGAAGRKRLHLRRGARLAYCRMRLVVSRCGSAPPLPLLQVPILRLCKRTSGSHLSCRHGSARRAPKYRHRHNL